MTDFDYPAHRVVADADGRLTCSCGELFATVLDLAAHRKEQEPLSVKCPTCHAPPGLSCNSAEPHRSRQERVGIFARNRSYRCRICRRGFNGPQDLEQHRRATGHAGRGV